MRREVVQPAATEVLVIVDRTAQVRPIGAEKVRLNRSPVLIKSRGEARYSPDETP